MLIASSSIYVIDKLEERKYVARKSCLKDWRVIFIEHTDEGHRLMETIFTQHEKAINAVFKGSDSAELNAMIKSLKKIGYRVQEVYVFYLISRIREKLSLPPFQEPKHDQIEKTVRPIDMVRSTSTFEKPLIRR